jgi:hypothetical protein
MNTNNSGIMQNPIGNEPELQTCSKMPGLDFWLSFWSHTSCPSYAQLCTLRAALCAEKQRFYHD